MITEVLLTMLMGLGNVIFTALNFAFVPVSFVMDLTGLSNLIGRVGFIFPIGTFNICLSVFVAFYSARASFKAFNWVLHLIRG